MDAIEFRREIEAVVLRYVGGPGPNFTLDNLDHGLWPDKIDVFTQTRRCTKCFEIRELDRP